MPPPQASEDFYTTLQRIQLLLIAAGRRAWSRMASDFDLSWRRVAPSLVQVTSAAQLAAATAATAYVPAVLDETGQPDEPEALIRPRAFAGVSSDGRSLATALEGSVRTAKARVATGASPEQALIGGREWLEQALQTAVADAARDATAAQIAVRQTMGWVRMVNPPCCSRCAVLAGKWYRWNDGFLRHPRCLPAGVVVSGPEVDAATRRWYDGELVVIRTASGKRLPITGNHPVLTGKGWLPAHLLVEGDDVVSRASGDRAMGLVVPDHDQMPARIEDLWRSNCVNALGRVPVAAEDFHGDGASGEVDVVLADGFLRRHVEAALAEEFSEVLLPWRSVPSIALAGSSSVDELAVGDLALPGCFLGGGHLLTEHLLGGVSHAGVPGLAPTAGRHSSLYETGADYPSGYPERPGNGVFALAREVPGHQLLDVEQVRAPRWDAPAGPMTVESRTAYASRGQDLLLWLSGQVSLDRVVDVSRVQWSGHVFNLTSVEGWYDADGIIVSNCDCIHIPTAENVADDFVTDPAELVRRELVTDLTPVQLQRVREGDDLTKVLNESRDAWRARMAIQRKAEKARQKRLRIPQGWGAAQQLPPGGIQDFMAHLTNRVEALNALRDHGIAE